MNGLGDLAKSVSAEALVTRVWRGEASPPTPIVTVIGTVSTIPILVIEIEDDTGTLGQGYASFHLQHAHQEREAIQMAIDFLSECRDIVALVGVEDQEEDGKIGRRPYSKTAASAISVAAWDLLGRASGHACADLWGRAPGTAQLSAYHSGLFLSSPLDALRREAEGARQRGHRLVKMRAGAAAGVEEDLNRLSVVAEVFSPESVAVDAYFSWSPSDIDAFIAGLGEQSVLWIEDPIPYGQLLEAPGFARHLAAGEECTTPAELFDICSAGVSRVILDLQQLGGPVRWLRAARMLERQGATVGSHIFPRESAQLLAGLSRTLPIEILDWWDEMFVEPVQVNDSGGISVSAPGMGSMISQEWLREKGDLVWTRSWRLAP